MTTTTPLADEELLRHFNDATLPASAFHHEQHLRVAWLFVTREGLPRALEKFPRALRRFAEANGAPGLYHATITWAYLLLINERQQRVPAATWDAFAAANGDLLSWKPSVLDTLYEHEVLWSEFARTTFVMPRKG
ncbi:MAG: hypothetical protein H0T71_09235 [Acidobacteria bacterium]|nr:hypothetical protein [Acidobacteriota bacterium]